MILIKLRVEEKGTTIVDCDFFDEDIRYTYDDKMTGKCSCDTIVLGENGVGKSFVLCMIADIFMNLEKAKTMPRKPKFRYERFYIKYCIGTDIFEVERVSSRVIKASKNNDPIPYKEIVLPKRILAVSFMVNDKFTSTENAELAYRYLGVRASGNSTYTSTILKKVYRNMCVALKNNRHEELKYILEMIGFESEYYKIAFRDGFEIRYEINKCDGEQWKIMDYFSKLVLVKDGKEVSFEACSSGEKHMLFALVGILGQIEDESVVLIDEPEISLHPDWQVKYVTTLDLVFKNIHNCHFILASHSHFLVSDLPPQKSSLLVFRRDGERFYSERMPYDTSAWSAENIIYNVFGLRTTRNFYFEQDLSRVIDIMNNTEMTEEKRREQLSPIVSKLKKYILQENDPLNSLIKEAEALIHV